ncbi:MAG: Lipase [Thermoleophilia bacterium]|nr:Lipase [Thermoleophilia bacterium]
MSRQQPPTPPTPPDQDRHRSAPRPPDRSRNGGTPVDVRLERAMRLLRGATVHGVKLSARAWTNHPIHQTEIPRVTHDRALVIVGGFAGSIDFYTLLRRSYEGAGFRRVAVMPPVDNAFADIRQSAERLGSIVRLLGGEVDIVGHSEGGLMARWFVKELGGADVVRHVVTLGTPNRGLPVRIEDYPWLERSAMARRVHKVVDTIADRTVMPMASVALRQMLRGSEFMATLGPEVPEGRTEYLAVRSRWDGVVPYGSADLPPGPNVANVALRSGPRQGNHGAIASTSVEAFTASLTFVRRD